MNRLPRICLCLALLLVGACALAAEVREVAIPASAGSLAPSIAALDDERFVVTWLEPTDGGHALKFSILDDAGFDSARTIAAGENWFANWADTPGLFVMPGGDWLAHWLVKSGPSTYAYDVVMARSRDAGRTWSEAFTPHADGTQTEHGFVSHFPAGDDRVGVVWLDGRETAGAASGHGAGAMTLRTATVGPAGTIEDERVLDGRVCDCCQTAAAMTADGPVVVYRDRSDDEIRDHALVRKTREGWSEPRTLHDDGWRIAACPVNGPAMIADGRQVAVAWFTMADETPRVELAVSGDAGASFERVDALGEGTALGRVDLAATGDGFVASWVDRPDGEGVLRLAGYDWSGRQRWQRAAVGLDAGRASGFPRLAAAGEGEVVIAWTGVRQGEQRVRAARVRLPAGARPEQE